MNQKSIRYWQARVSEEDPGLGLRKKDSSNKETQRVKGNDPPIYRLSHHIMSGSVGNPNPSS